MKAQTTDMQHESSGTNITSHFLEQNCGASLSSVEISRSIREFGCQRLIRSRSH
jgi:hypothetical protein